jgi:ribosomal protein S18 acetylase RimI-like enzyme
MEPKLRPLVANDLEPIYGWVEKNPLFAKYRMSRATLAPALERAVGDPETAVIGAFDPDGALCGFVWFAKKGAFARSGYLRLIAVDPDAKASGTGRALLNHLEAEFLKPNGIFLLATDVNTEAHAFYTKLGYRKVGEIPDYVAPGLTEWIFHKPAPLPNS